MASRGRRTGTCHICGMEGELSFEHVPPRAAFNDRPVLRVPCEKAIHLGPDEVPKGRVQQGGAGGYTLCPRCNNTTGKWYGARFVDWCYKGMEILRRTGGRPSLIYISQVFPLAVLKQIIVMFFSLNTPSFARANPELVRLVLNRDAKYLSPTYRFFAYYSTTGRWRYVGLTGILSLGRGEASSSTCLLSEIGYPPFGYVMTVDSGPPDDRLYEITHFARYGYNDFRLVNLTLPVLPTCTAFPGDYRTKEQVTRQIADSQAWEKAQKAKGGRP